MSADVAKLDDYERGLQIGRTEATIDGLAHSLDMLRAGQERMEARMGDLCGQVRSNSARIRMLLIMVSLAFAGIGGLTGWILQRG